MFPVFVGLFLLLIVLVVIIVKYSYDNMITINDNEYGIVRLNKDKLNPFTKKHSKGVNIALNNESGWLPDILYPGTYWQYWPLLYTLERYETIELKEGEIILVTARNELSNIPPTSTDLIECDNFENARAFLENGGRKGMQKNVISFTDHGPTHYLHPKLFEWDIVPMTYVPPGAVGVIFSLHGDKFDGPTNKPVPKGYKGIQSYTIEPGSHPINTVLERVILVPTTPIILHWSDNIYKDPLNYDYELKPIEIIANDGGKITLEISQEIQIEAHEAPRVIAHFGIGKAELIELVDDTTNKKDKYSAIRILVVKVLQTTISSEFLKATAGNTSWDYYENRADIQNTVKRTISEALKARGIKAINTLINDINLPADVEKYRKELEQVERDAHIRQRKTEKDVEFEAIRIKKDKLTQDREVKEAEHQAIILQIAQGTELNNLQYLVDILGIEGVLKREFFQQLSTIKLPTTMIGDSGWLNPLAMWHQTPQQINKPAISQTQIGDFVESLTSYLQDGGDQKIRTAFSKLLNNPSQLTTNSNRPPQITEYIQAKEAINESQPAQIKANTYTTPEKQKATLYVQTQLDKITNEAWALAGASVQGTSHTKTNIPCQDWHGYIVLDDNILLLAIADGLGSASKAHIGAQTAVTTILAFLEEHFQHNEANDTSHLENIMQAGFNESIQAINQLATRNNEPIKNYNTTLTCAVVLKNHIVIGSIGDGAIVALLNNQELRTIYAPQESEFINQTNVLSKDNLEHKTDFVVQNISVNAIALFTDGVRFLSLDKNNIPFSEFFMPFFEGMKKIQNRDDSQHASKNLGEVLMSDKICLQTDDDKTLLLAKRK